MSKSIWLTVLVLLFVDLVAAASTPCIAADTSYGAGLYQKNCEACHHIGENIIRPEKTMARSDKLKTKSEFKKFLARQNGLMPPYKTIVRSDKDLQALYLYIKQLNEKQQPPASPNSK